MTESGTHLTSCNQSEGKEKATTVPMVTARTYTVRLYVRRRGALRGQVMATHLSTDSTVTRAMDRRPVSKLRYSTWAYCSIFTFQASTGSKGWMKQDKLIEK